MINLYYVQTNNYLDAESYLNQKIFHSSILITILEKLNILKKINN